MTAREWRIEVERVVVRGAPTRGLDAAELRTAVGEAVAAALRDGPLPAGRAVRASVVVEAGRLAAGPEAVGRAVAGAVAGAVRGGSGG